MMGVVLWACGRRRQAVIWCEDHGPLAMLGEGEHDIPAGSWPVPGDLMEFQPETVGELRHARRAAPLRDVPRMALPELLRATPPAKRQPVLRVLTGGAAAASPPERRRAVG